MPQPMPINPIFNPEGDDKIENHYQPICKPNQLILGTGNTVVVTGWTPRNVVAKHLDPSRYAAVGNLYSAERGLSPLLRNLAANPHVNKIITLGVTREDRNSGSVEVLHRFFATGEGTVDPEIPRGARDYIRQNVEVVRAKSIEQVGLMLLVPGSMPHRGIAQTFPESRQTPSVAPGPRYGHRITGATVAETWVKILHRIKTTGTIRPTGYDGEWQELINLMAIVTGEPRRGFFPEPNFLPVTPESLMEYLPNVLDDAPYVPGVKYSYGQRLRSWFGVDQVEQVITKLAGEIDAASAVMSLWDAKDHDAGGSPCLNHIWVRVVDNELSLTATFRSNDMFSAWPSNAMALRALQFHILDNLESRYSLDLSIGPLITVSQSAHIYDDCWGSVDNLIAAHHHYRPSYADPVGYFVIEWIDGCLVVAHSTPHGDPVREYRGVDPLKVVRAICHDNPAIAPDHAAYLGLELARAAARQDNYIQDARL